VIRLSLIVCSLLLCSLSIAQQLICPPNETRNCYDDLDAQPQVIDGAGYNLLSSREFTGSNCNVSSAINTYKLIDLETGETVASCEQKIIVKPFSQTVLFPRDTIVSGYTLSEVLNETVLTDGIFPSGTNDCSIIYSYEDVPVEAYPLMYVFRHWTALSWCSGETYSYRQQIVLRDMPNNSIATQVSDCANEEITIDSIEIFYNDDIIDWSYCFVPFTDLHDVLNCVADSLLIEDEDRLSLRLGDITNPYLGISSKDLIDIQRHILGLKRFESDCRLSAADVNRDGQINGIDLVETRKLILGIYTSWPYGSGPEYYVNGEKRNDLSFKKEDFPLSSLEITVANQANTSTK